ncbi:MAG: hypothetical protein AMXMBFR4_02330 [Candidatus Hydrogenedentota bacterium]
MTRTCVPIRHFRVGRLLSAVFACAAEAELENIQVGGSIEVYGAYYSSFFADANRLAWPEYFLSRRPIGGNGTATYVDNDGTGNNSGFVEQRTKVNVLADFTSEVSAFVEFDSVWTWGEGFRSDYATGVDHRDRANDGDAEIYQAYLEARDVFGLPLDLRVGRQALEFGNEWLVGSNPDPDPFVQLSFDALRLTVRRGALILDLWAAQLAESGAVEEDGDTWFYGVYGSYSFSPVLEGDLYYLFLRDATRRNDTQFISPLERLEEWTGLDDYDPSTLYTVGARAAGGWNGVDYYLEAAYQWGDADALGSTFRTYGVYGDDEARYRHWAATFEAGYTFAARFLPRVFLAGAYFDASDERAVDVVEWANPFHRPDASVAFNRLFSTRRYTHFLDYSALSNFWFIRAGIEAQPTERFSVSLDVMYHEAVEPFDLPRSFDVGPLRVPIAPALSFWTEEGRDELGVEIMLAPEYVYSDDLRFSMQFVYYFVGSAFQDGVFFDENATRFIGGTGDDDAASVTFIATFEF